MEDGLDEDHEKDVTLNRACKELRLSKRMLFYRIREKHIPAHKHGWQWFVFAADIDAAKDTEWYRNSRLTAA
jgi:hypothetical protein